MKKIKIDWRWFLIAGIVALIGLGLCSCSSNDKQTVIGIYNPQSLYVIE